jgi:glycerophosphoryl diester phosphodiesterase
MPLELLKSKTGRTLIESHRGMQGDVPENSWTAIQLGYQLGADLIEVDIQLSCDDVPFLRHNYQLPDTRWCHHLSWNELEELKIEGTLFPKLEDVLIWARDAGACLSLDLKTFFKQEGRLTKEVLRCIEHTNTKDNVLLLFFDHEELLHTKLVHPELMVRALITGRPVNFAGYLQEIKADCVSISYGMLCPTDIEEIHSVGISVVLGDLWNPKVDLFQKYDIDIFTCGSPVEARKILNHP